jgi:hypothetical protein
MQGAGTLSRSLLQDDQPSYIHINNKLLLASTIPSPRATANTKLFNKLYNAVVKD